MKKVFFPALLALLLPAGGLTAADFDGDGTGDVAVFRPATGLWAVRWISRFYFGGTGDEPVPGDYNGAGRDVGAVFRSGSGLWAVRGVTRIYFGGAADTARPGDFDGDRTDDAAIFRPATGLWAARGVTRFYFGGSSDQAISPGKATGPVACELSVTGQTQSYRTGDDGDLEEGAAFDFEKFNISGVEITVDNNTGLIWAADGSAKGCAYGQQTDWESAVNWCRNLTFAGSSDWRLPNVRELHSIVDFSETYPCIDKTKFPNTEQDWYWTSTTYDYQGSKAWVIEFDVGGLNFAPEKSSQYFLRAVTGPEL